LSRGEKNTGQRDAFYNIEVDKRGKETEFRENNQEKTAVTPGGRKRVELQQETCIKK